MFNRYILFWININIIASTVHWLGHCTTSTEAVTWCQAVGQKFPRFPYFRYIFIQFICLNINSKAVNILILDFAVFTIKVVWYKTLPVFYKTPYSRKFIKIFSEMSEEKYPRNITSTGKQIRIQNMK